MYSRSQLLCPCVRGVVGSAHWAEKGSRPKFPVPCRGGSFRPSRVRRYRRLIWGKHRRSRPTTRRAWRGGRIHINLWYSFILAHLAPMPEWHAAVPKRMLCCWPGGPQADCARWPRQRLPAGPCLGSTKLAGTRLSSFPPSFPCPAKPPTKVHLNAAHAGTLVYVRCLYRNRWPGRVASSYWTAWELGSSCCSFGKLHVSRLNEAIERVCWS